MRNRWLMACGIVGILGIGLFVGLGLVVGAAFALTRPVVDASEQFLALLGQGKIPEAYACAASSFRAQQDGASFARLVRQTKLTDYASVSWHNRQIDNQEGLAEGTLTTKSGGTSPIAVRLVWEGARWAVGGVRYAGLDLALTQSAPTVPGEAELERMVASALLEFNQAVLAQDFTGFYGNLAEVWKKQTTPQQLQQAFQPFIDKKIDIGPIKDIKPQFASPARLSDGGVLKVAGHFPTEPSQVKFELQYVQEGGSWKLTAIRINVGKERATQA
jgi:hypothetical protein